MLPAGATSSLLSHPIPAEKYIVVVRHGQTTWNLEGRVQGNTEESFLTEKGRLHSPGIARMGVPLRAVFCNVRRGG